MHAVGEHASARGPGACSRPDKFIHSEIASQALFGHEIIPFFGLTCMLASCPREICDYVHSANN